MNKIAIYAAVKAVKLHQENLRGTHPGDGNWHTSRDMYRLTFNRIRGLMSPYAAARARGTYMEHLRELKQPMLSTLEINGFRHLGGTDHWCY
jgi:hypothetical protein